MDAFEDPQNEANSPKHHSGHPCAVKGCPDPAGTAWSPFWCFKHNVERIRRINAGLRRIEENFEKQKK